MSHVTTIDLEIKDLEALKAACNRLGLKWMEGQQTYKWYGQWVGDYPMPQGFNVNELGKCQHAIQVPGASYEIGIVTREGKTNLLWDFYSAGRLEHVLGQGGGKLKQAYAAEVTTRAARRAGYSVYERQEEGRIRLTIQRRE